MTSLMTLSLRHVPAGLACEAGRSTWCREFVGVLGGEVDVAESLVEGAAGGGAGR